MRLVPSAKQSRLGEQKSVGCLHGSVRTEFFFSRALRTLSQTEEKAETLKTETLKSVSALPWTMSPVRFGERWDCAFHAFRQNTVVP